ncbi:hypothetical protein [Kitasatospora cinereorecta]|uniref:Uncharacterized protein n=1 Tax=Kitasatospora cinereorecta TaxID=285560 RepID=A0ABW0VJ83_9ACTN
MRYIHLQAGAPSSRELEAGAPPRHLAHTTLDRLLDTHTKPRLPSSELLEAFLAGCGIPAPRRKAWHDTRQLLAGNPGMSARALARIARTRSSSPYRPPGGRVPQERSTWSHDRVEEDALREEKNQQLQALRKNHTAPDELDWANDYGTGEDEYLH